VVERERVTIAMMTKSRFMPLWDHMEATGETYDLSSLKKVMIGAEHTTAEDLKQIMDFCGVSISGKVYGITEAGASVTRLLPCDIAKGFHRDATEKDKRKLESAGKPLLGARIRLVDSEGRDVPQGDIGEVIVKGDQVSPGYWNDPALTQGKFRDGWYHTNDLGVFDEDGYLYLKGRKDFVIKTGGVLVPPVNVEDAIRRHPAVNEVVVIGVPSERWGQAVKAVVGVKKGHHLTEEEVKRHCREHLSGFQVPKSVQFVESLPRSAAGRVETKKVLALYGK
jgi:acyl-CoA synthetase (AMP-forming)/AMP-acid ligase II